jgi:hypothetical protein
MADVFCFECQLANICCDDDDAFMMQEVIVIAEHPINAYTA